MVLQNTLLHLETEVKQIKTTSVLSVSSHSEYKVTYLILLSAKKTSSVLILFKAIGKVSTLHLKGEEPREIVSNFSS